MKKSVVALAVFGAFHAAANAEAEATLYGIVDVAMRQDTAPAAGKPKLAEVGGMMNTSRWGVRGSEDLGGGLKANFRLEGGINPDTGTQNESASLFDRRATVGLSGNWGQLDVGRDMSFGWQFTPVYDPLGGALATPTPTSHASGKASLLVNGFMFVTNNPYNDAKLRDNNVKYQYTAQNGLFAGLDYSFGEAAGSTSRKSGRQAALGYMKGDINVITSYDQLRDANDRTQRVVIAGGNVKASGRIKFTLGYAAMTADALFAPASNVVSGAIANYASTFGVAANGTIKVATSAAGIDYSFTPRLSLIGAAYNTRVSGTGISSNDYNTFALFSKYALSKRTFLYASVDHEKATTHGAQATVSGKDSNTGVTAGMQMRF